MMYHNFYYFVLVVLIQSVKEFNIKLIYQLCTFSLLVILRKVEILLSIHTCIFYFYLFFLTKTYVESSQTERLKVIN